MELHDQLFRYFGTSDLAALTPDVLTAGLEHMRVDFGLERDRGRRFALWTLMYMLGEAPDLPVDHGAVTVLGRLKRGGSAIWSGLAHW